MSHCGGFHADLDLLERNGTASGAHASSPLDLAGRAVLLATDGSPASAASPRLAAALAAKYHARVHALTVIDTSAAPIPPPLNVALALADSAIGAGVHEQQVAALRAVIADVTKEECHWPVHVKRRPAERPDRAATRQ